MSTAGQHGTPRSWQINGLQLAALTWGEPDRKPLLALHGWLDNAASFTRLAPLLEEHFVVALDLTGHGKSDCRSADASYQIWDDLPEILGVVDALGWSSFDLLGHSRGAIIATLLAAALPQRIEHLVMLDALSPEAVPAADFPAQMRKSLLDRPALVARGNRVMDSMAKAAKSRERRGLSAYAARVISERNLRPCEGGYTWTTDPRLHGASAVKLSDAQIEAVLGALNMPALLLLAADGDERQRAWMEQHARKHIPNITVAKVDGGHHFHLEDGVADVAIRVRDFLSG